jgi:hypothetical protein
MSPQTQISKGFEARLTEVKQSLKKVSVQKPDWSSTPGLFLFVTEPLTRWLETLSSQYRGDRRREPEASPLSRDLVVIQDFGDALERVASFTGSDHPPQHFLLPLVLNDLAAL